MLFNVTHLLFDFGKIYAEYGEDIAKEYFAAFWRSLQEYYGAHALPPLALMLRELDLGEYHEGPTSFRAWIFETSDDGRIKAEVYTTNKDLVLFDIPHQHHRDFLSVCSSMLDAELFFRHYGQGKDDFIQLWKELKTWFFKPLLKAFASLPFSYKGLEDFKVAYVNPQGCLRTTSLAMFAKEADILV